MPAYEFRAPQLIPFQGLNSSFYTCSTDSNYVNIASSALSADDLNRGMRPSIFYIYRNDADSSSILLTHEPAKRFTAQ